MNPESKFSRWLIDKIFIDAHVQRIETSTGSGVPDMNVCHKGREFWVETKIQQPNGDVLLRPYQWAWINRRAAHNGRGYVIAECRDGESVLVWPFHYVKIEPRSDHLKIISLPVPFAKIDQTRLRAFLYATTF